MLLRVQCFGASRLWCGADELELDIPAATPTVGDAEQTLAERFPNFAAQRQRMAYALGDSVVASTHRLHGNDTLVLIPPVSGG